MSFHLLNNNLQSNASKNKYNLSNQPCKKLFLIRLITILKDLILNPFPILSSFTSVTSYSEIYIRIKHIFIPQHSNSIHNTFHHHYPFLQKDTGSVTFKHLFPVRSTSLIYNFTIEYCLFYEREQLNSKRRKYRLLSNAISLLNKPNEFESLLFSRLNSLSLFVLCLALRSRFYQIQVLAQFFFSFFFCKKGQYGRSIGEFFRRRCVNKIEKLELDAKDLEIILLGPKAEGYDVLKKYCLQKCMDLIG